jgi:hypothetical protein
LERRSKCNRTSQFPRPPESGASWPQIYQAAIKDAINPEPGEIVHHLTAIVQGNPELFWKDVNGVRYVLMVSLAGNTSFYEASMGKPYNTGGHYIWVTAVPDVRKLCGQQDFGGDDTPMRLRQLLGLTPTVQVIAFVEFWVNPAQLFRPAADNEITDTTAGLNLPENTEPWYRQWFNELRATQYFQSEQPRHEAYPWTQLGYTFDWGNPGSRVGVSEFVIKTNADVIVNGIIPINMYCNTDGK